jgi:hypothetical protein
MSAQTCRQRSSVHAAAQFRPGSLAWLPALGPCDPWPLLRTRAGPAGGLMRRDAEPVK